MSPATLAPPARPGTGPAPIPGGHVAPGPGHRPAPLRPVPPGPPTAGQDPGPASWLDEGPAEFAEPRWWQRPALGVLVAVVALAAVGAAAWWRYEPAPPPQPWVGWLAPRLPVTDPGGQTTAPDADDDTTGPATGAPGELGPLGPWAVTVRDVRADATEVVVAASTANNPPPDGHRYVLATVELTNRSGSTLTTATVGFDLVVDGQRLPDADAPCGVPPERLPVAEVPPGGSVTGTVCWSVPTGAPLEAVVVLDVTTGAELVVDLP